MNHFAHLVLAQPTPASIVGNLLGDFARGVDIESLDPAIRAGLENHRLVDRVTDSDSDVQNLKRLFSEHRRRFAGIALDIWFDHLLIRHWSRWDERPLESVFAELYALMTKGLPMMPRETMQYAARRMIEYDWFGSYRDENQVAEAMDRVASRIRFRNQFDGAIDDLRVNQAAIEAVFIDFYPRLREAVEQAALETVTD